MLSRTSPTDRIAIYLREHGGGTAWQITLAKKPTDAILCSCEFDSPKAAQNAFDKLREKNLGMTGGVEGNSINLQIAPDYMRRAIGGRASSLVEQPATYNSR